jgi:hypothetical protein
MQTAPFIESLQADLRDLAALGDENIAQAADRLATAIRSSAGLRLLDALSEAALEISAQLPEGHVEVRLVGPDPELVYVPAEPVEPAPAREEDGLAARITLRLYDSLKRELEAAAAREGVSLNTWLVRTLARNTAPPPRRTGRRLTGYAKN